jgi:hypothetical protein
MASLNTLRVTCPEAAENTILAATGDRDQRKFLRITNVDPTNICYISALAAATVADIVLYPSTLTAAAQIGAPNFIEWTHPNVPQGEIRGLAVVADVELIIETN